VILRPLQVVRTTRTTLILFDTFKNAVLAAAIGLTLFGDRTSLPAAVMIVSNVGFAIWPRPTQPGKQATG